MSIAETAQTVKFEMLEGFAHNLISSHDKKVDENQDFLFTIDMDPSTEEAVKEYLIKQKSFVLNYIVSRGHFVGSQLYQLYLEYIPYELTEVEKSILLDGYIKMVTDLKGNVISIEKRNRLEKSLHMNQD